MDTTVISSIKEKPELRRVFFDFIIGIWFGLYDCVDLGKLFPPVANHPDRHLLPVCYRPVPTS